MNEFMYVFQINKMTVFEVNYYTLSSNKSPHFATSAAQFIRSKRDYSTCGQCQKRVLPKNSAAYRFFEKWDNKHLKNLTDDEWKEITSDVEKLKERYNYIEKVRDTFKGTSTRIPYYDIVELSKMSVKKAVS